MILLSLKSNNAWFQSFGGFLKVLIIADLAFCVLLKIFGFVSNNYSVLHRDPIFQANCPLAAVSWFSHMLGMILQSSKLQAAVRTKSIVMISSSFFHDHFLLFSPLAVAGGI